MLLYVPLMEVWLTKRSFRSLKLISIVGYRGKPLGRVGFPLPRPQDSYPTITGLFSKGYKHICHFLYLIEVYALTEISCFESCPLNLGRDRTSRFQMRQIYP